jgi:hypothetical protein
MSKRKRSTHSSEEEYSSEEIDMEMSWVSASKTRNHLMRDPLLDWLNMYRNGEYKNTMPNIISIGESAPKIPKINDKGKEDEDEFPILDASPIEIAVPALDISRGSYMFILEQGNQFETAVMAYLRQSFPNKIEQIAMNHHDIRQEQKADDTLTAMKRGVPFIYQAVFHDHEYNTYGSPDLLVRSDYLEKFIGKIPLSKADIGRKALKLKKRGQRRAPAYHYVVVDIKYSTLHFRADGVCLLNNGSVPAYKSQMYIYHRALAKLQGYNPKYTFLLGRNWTHTKCGKKTNGTGCFERLGAIDFRAVDRSFIERSNEAVAWIRRLRVEGAGWDVYPKPSVPELYPNMSNKNDAPWHNKKKEIAEKINEITSVWYCGTKHRKRALEEGVDEWTDSKCTPEVMGFKKRKKDDEKPRLGDIIGEILDINRQDEDLLRPEFIKNNYRNWQSLDTDVINRPIELFVDFETVHSAAASAAESSVDGSVHSIFGRLRRLSRGDTANNDMIFIIGCGWIETEYDLNGFGHRVWKYERFVAQELSFRSERKMMNEFYDHVANLTDRELKLRKQIEPNFWNSLKQRVKGLFGMFERGEVSYDLVENTQFKINIYHWGHIEPTTYERACMRHPREAFNDKLIKENWVDFYNIMKAEPIVVKGSLSFGLKTIVKNMNQNGLINLQWDEDGCANGMEAMAEAVKIYRQAFNTGEDVLSNEKMNSIVAYNEIDCKAVYVIVDYLRTYHPFLRNVEEIEELQLGIEPMQLSEEEDDVILYDSSE